MTHFFGKTEMPVDEEERTFLGFDDDDLGPAGLVISVGEGDLVVGFERPAGKDQVAVAPVLQMHIHLIKLTHRVEMVGQKLGLIVKMGALDVPIDLLKADDIRIFLLDNVDDPVEAVPAILASDPFVDVVSKKSHRKNVWGQAAKQAGAGTTDCGGPDKFRPMYGIRTKTEKTL